MYNGRIDDCGKRIKKALAIRGMKQTELCELAKIPKGSLSLYISGAYEPKQDRLYEMAKVLNVDPVWLMGFDVPMEKQSHPTAEQELSEGVRVLVDLFNQVPVENQEMVLDMIKIAVKNNQSNL